MGMVKLVSPSGWDFDNPITSLIKVSSRGLIGEDRRLFIKRASSSENIFLPYLDSVKFAADEVPVHLIALGANEFYGPNRNGDGFSESVLRQHHPSFVKYARFYRNHKNKDPRKSYGIVKLSAWNPVMKRVELLCGLNAEKSAADRNGGLVADRELEKLARGDDLCVSMACRVPYDECSFCHHKAPNRDQYCTADMCKAGGCAENLTRLVKVGGDTHHLHVRNHFPTFFDISDVFRPADRTAWGARADYLEKAAADHGFIGTDGAKLAEDLGVIAPLAVILAQELPYGEYSSRVQGTIKLAYGLDLLQRQLNDGSGAVRAFSSQMQPEMDLSGLEPEDGVKIAAALGALADRKIVMPLRDFARLTNRAEQTEKAASLLHGVYGRMIGDGTLERRVADSPYLPADTLASRKQRDAAAHMISDFSLEKSAVERRALKSVIRNQTITESRSVSGIEKLAADAPEAEELARDYACYKAAALERISRFDNEFILTARFAEWQNRAV